MVDTASRAEARLNDSCRARKRRIHAYCLIVEQRKGCSAIGGFPNTIRRKSYAVADSSTTYNGADATHSARGSNVHRASVNNDGRDGPSIEGWAGIRRSRLKAAETNGCSTIHGGSGYRGGRRQLRPSVSAVSRLVDPEASLRIGRSIGLAGSGVE